MLRVKVFVLESHFLPMEEGAKVTRERRCEAREVGRNWSDRRGHAASAGFMSRSQQSLCQPSFAGTPAM